jgi:pimeloyl-ACP methyl ester carboxylesterase
MTATAPPIERFVEVDGLRLRTTDWGGDGPPLVIHHATGFLARVYDPFAALLRRRFRVLGLDARGHGGSDKPEGGYRWERFIADLIAVIEGFGVGPVVGLGHSLGGTTTAGAAAERPDLFTHIVLLDPIFLPREFRNVTAADNHMAAAARRRRREWDGAAAVLAAYGSRPPFSSWRENALRAYVEHGFEPAGDGRVRLRCPPEIEAQVFSMAPSFDGWSMLDRIVRPTLVVRGETSQAFSARDMAKALSRLRRGTGAEIAGHGHLFPMEVPEQAAALVESFVERAPPAEPRMERGD